MSVFQAGEFHAFPADGRPFVYLVPSGGIFELDPMSVAILERVAEKPKPREELVAELTAAGFAYTDVDEAITELQQSHALRTPAGFVVPPQEAPENFPLQTLVMNLTNQCNLCCQYCYEFGEDKVATPEGKPKFMDLETAKTSVDFLLEQSPGRKAVHITFFGGETLMNFPLLKNVVAYATEQAAAQGRTIDFSL